MFISQAQAAILSRNGLLQGANPSQHEVMLEKYGNMLRHLQGYVYITVFIISFHLKDVLKCKQFISEGTQE